MDSSGGQHPRFRFYNSRMNLVSNDNNNEELSWGLFNFNDEVESPKHLLDSSSSCFPFSSNIISSPSSYYGLDFKEEETSVSGSMKNQVLEWEVKSQPNQIDFSMGVNKIEPESIQSPQNHYKFDQIQVSKEQGRFEDGYNWRKYGEKQVKGSKKPRSYFKCSNPNCPTKKKVEKDFNGYITEIIYKGKHNHLMPQKMRKSSLNTFSDTIMDYSTENNCFESSKSPFGENEYDQESSISKSLNERENEPNAKRWKLDEAESDLMSHVGSRTTQEPRVVIETKSEIDILDDGYKWRKYGQKVVKGNPNPRSYYKCTNKGCPVRKLVERASHDIQAVITTYEAKHNHSVPQPRGNGIYTTNQPYTSNTNQKLPNYSKNVHEIWGLTNDDNRQTSHVLQTFDNSESYGFLESSYLNQDWKRGEFLLATKKEPENDFIFNSYLD